MKFVQSTIVNVYILWYFNEFIICSTPSVGISVSCYTMMTCTAQFMVYVHGVVCTYAGYGKLFSLKKPGANWTKLVQACS